MRVVIAEAAYADLLDIGRTIARDSPGRASSFVDELHERCKGLSTMAQAFPLLPGWEERGVRRRPFGDYLIFYRISARGVQVLRVLHGARDYEASCSPTSEVKVGRRRTETSVPLYGCCRKSRWSPIL